MQVAQFKPLTHYFVDVPKYKIIVGFFWVEVVTLVHTLVHKGEPDEVADFIFELPDYSVRLFLRCYCVLDQCRRDKNFALSQ